MSISQVFIQVQPQGKKYVHSSNQVMVEALKCDSPVAIDDEPLEIVNGLPVFNDLSAKVLLAFPLKIDFFMNGTPYGSFDVSSIREFSFLNAKMPSGSFRLKIENPNSFTVLLPIKIEWRKLITMQADMQ